MLENLAWHEMSNCESLILWICLNQSVGIIIIMPLMKGEGWGDELS